MTNHRSQLSALALGAVLALTGTSLAACAPQETATGPAAAQAAPAQQVAAQVAAMHNHGVQSSLQARMRTLWNQHMTWTWDTVVAFAEGSPSLPAHLDRLLRNQQDIGDAIAPFYGDAAGHQLTELLTTHITLAVPVLTAAKNGDDAALQQALADWYANAADIADFLSAANPDNWPQTSLEP